MPRLASAVAAAVVVLGSAPARAQPVPQGSQFQINGYTTGDQVRPSVCATAGSEFVVSFADRDLNQGLSESGRDGSGSAVFARRISDTGVAQGPEFVVNTYTTGNQGYAAVVCPPAGEFSVGWSDWPNFDGGHTAFLARPYDAQGAPKTSPITIQGDPLIGGPAEQATVCRGPADEVLAVWVDGSNSLYARRYDSDAQALGTEFLVLSDSSTTVAHPACCGGDAGFVVAWSDYMGGDVGAQRYSTAGEPVGTEFVLNTYTTGTQRRPAISCDDTGRFVVVWESAAYGGVTPQDGDGHGIFGQAFFPDATHQGSEFQANTYTTGDQLYPAVAAANGGRFVVAWDSPQIGQDHRGIFTQAFNAHGVPVGTEFRADDGGRRPQSSDSARAAVAMQADGDFMVAWQNDQDDRDQNGVAGLIYSFAAVVSTTTTVPGTSTTTLGGTTTTLSATSTTAAPSTSEPATTTTVIASTTTTLAPDLCGNPAPPNTSVTANDALFVLRTAVGLATCPDCVCDVDSSGSISAADALRTLRVAVGQTVSLACPAC